MECNTIYIVRESGGSLWAAGTGWQTIDFASPALLERTARGLPSRFTPSESFAAKWCRGWYLDLRERRARTFRCNLSGTQLAALDHALRNPGQPLPRFSPAYLVIGPEWQGWDAGVAWERASDLCTLAGVPQASPSYELALDEWVDCCAAHLFTAYPNRARFPHVWEPEDNRLTYEQFDEASAMVLTTIDERGRVHDYAFESSGLLAALGIGPRLVGELRGHAPCPDPGSQPSTGAVIDERSREVWLWRPEPLSPATYAELRARWPGWTISRERTALDGHLVRTGGASRSEPSGTLVYLERVHATVVLPEPPADERALLDAIHTAPEADEPRLVYADLLTMRGDPRGQMITLGVELAELDRTARYSPRRLQLAREVTRLQTLFAWEDVPGTRSVGYARGFIARVTVDSVADLLQHRVLERFPTITDLELTRCKPGDLDALAGVVGLARLRRLRLPAPGAAISWLGSIEALSGLRQLDITAADTGISLNEVADALAGLLARAHPFQQLEHLILRGRGFHNTSLHRLFSQARLPALHRLELHDMPGLREPTALANSANLPALRSFALWNVGLTDADILRIARNPRFASVERWSQDAWISPKKLVAELPELRRLSIQSDLLTRFEVAELAHAPVARQLRCLLFGKLGADALRALAESPYLDSLDELWVSARDDTPAQTAEAIGELRAVFGDRLAL